MRILEETHLILDLIGLYFEVTFRACTRPWRGKDILHYISILGVESLPIIAISTAFSGIVVTSEIAWHLDYSLHTVSMMPGVTAQFILRELGIAIPALLMVSKVGASIAAEVGSMKVTDQIDALKLLKIDPIEYLIVPRFIACAVAMACLTLISICITMLCSVLVAVGKYHFIAAEFLQQLRHFVSASDLYSALIKGVIFGSVIPVIACAYGLSAKSGAEGVGTATTQAVVSSTTAIIVLDFILTFCFTRFLY